MIPLEPIHTPNGDIFVGLDDGEVWIKQNTLTVAMGYNKYLSSKYSRLGQCISHSKACKKFSGAIFIRFKPLVENILPVFLGGFLREVNSSDSLQQFFGNSPNDIYANAKAVFKILKERCDMSTYCKGSPADQKGTLGELIYKRYLEAAGYSVTILHDQKPAIYAVDLLIARGDEDFYAEVKTYDIQNHYDEQAFCIEKEQVNRSVGYAESEHKRLEFVFVDCLTGKIYRQWSEKLLCNFEKPIRGMQFPAHIDFANKENPKSNPGFAFHVRQFEVAFSLSKTEIDAIRAIKIPSKKNASVVSPKQTAKIDTPKPVIQGVLPLEQNKQGATFLPKKTITVNKQSIRTVTLSSSGELYFQATDIARSLQLDQYSTDSHLGRYCAENDYLCSKYNEFTHKVTARFLNANGIIQDVLPKVISGKIYMYHRARQAAPIVLADLKKALDIKETMPLPPTKQPQPANSNLDLPNVTNLFAQASGIDKQDLIKFMLSEQSKKFEAEQARAKRQFEQQQAKLKELLK